MPASTPPAARGPDPGPALVECVRALERLGLNHGTVGNASVRTERGLLITPSGVPYDTLVPGDLVHLDLRGRVLDAPPGRRPSSEWRMHVALLASRPAWGAVVHTHGRAVSTLACLRRGIPPFHYMVAIAGANDIPCAPYATFGTEALSRALLEHIGERWACLLANHGMVAGGRSLRHALQVAVEVEWLAEVYWRALQGGEPVLLGEGEMQAVHEQFRSGYGAPGAVSASCRPDDPPP